MSEDMKLPELDELKRGSPEWEAAEEWVEDLRNGGEAYCDIAVHAMMDRTRREAQLLAEITENKELRNAEVELFKKLDAKDEKIADLEKQSDEWETHAGNHVDRIRKLESLLRAVSEALKEKLERVSIGPNWPDVYSKAEVDARIARLRAIVEGK